MEKELEEVVESIVRHRNDSNKDSEIWGDIERLVAMVEARDTRIAGFKKMINDIRQADNALRTAIIKAG